jgi:hypothetical protein
LTNQRRDSDDLMVLGEPRHSADREIRVLFID